MPGGTALLAVSRNSAFALLPDGIWIVDGDQTPLKKLGSVDERLTAMGRQAALFRFFATRVKERSPPGLTWRGPAFSSENSG